ncbi:MAG TPA: hypothetical protein PK657_06770, partial [Legionella sp.]|nr:hypothetical protein [Legionella sp.]
MPQNTALSHALKDTRRLATLGLDECMKALDEMLRVQPTDAVGFRKAVVDHQNFWHRYNEQLVKAPAKPTGLIAQATGLIARASGWALRRVGWSTKIGENSQQEANYFLSPDFLNPDDEVSFPVLQQLAAEQLAILSLYNASNDKLASLMNQNNREDVERQLKSLAGQERADRILVTDETIEKVRSLATRLYIRNIVDTMNDESSLNELISAKTPEEYHAALVELLQMPFGVITELYPEDRTLLTNRLNTLRAAAARNAIFTQILAIGDDASLNNIKVAANQEELDRAVRVLIPDYENGSLSLLTPEEKDLIAIQQKKNIRLKLLSRIVELANSQESLDTLTNAANQNALNNSAKALLPSYADDALIYPLPAEDQNIINSRRIKLRNEAEKVSITTYIENVSDSDILNWKNGLESSGFEFANRVRQQFPNFHNRDIDWAKSKLGVRYLKSVIPTLNNDLLPVINAENKDLFLNKLKEILGNHDYISLAVTDENVAELKNIMIINHLNRWTSADNSEPTIKVLYELLNAPKSSDFKQDLNKVGVRADWLDKANIELMKQDIGARIFSMAIGNISKFRANSYAEINKVFRDLPVEKQKTLLKGLETGDIPNIRHLIHAADAHGVAYYLGDNPAVQAAIPAILTNNKRISLLGQIHNAGVSRALASIKSDLNLDDQRINAINNLPPFTTPEQYLGFVAGIKAQLPQGLSDELLNNAFGVNNNAIHNQRIYNEIRTQQDFNAYLLGINDPTIKKHQQFINLLLNTYKREHLDEQKFNTIFSALKNSNTLSKFLDLLPDVTDADKFLKRQLTNELSAVLFNNLKIEHRTIDLKNIVPLPILNKMQKELKEIQLDNKQHVQNSKSLKYITTINSAELF